MEAAVLANLMLTRPRPPSIKEAGDLRAAAQITGIPQSTFSAVVRRLT